MILDTLINPKLAETCNLSAYPEGSVVLDPFIGSGTTGYLAKELNRHYFGIKLNPDYCRLARKRIETASTKSI